MLRGQRESRCVSANMVCSTLLTTQDAAKHKTCNAMTALIQVVTAAQVMLTLLSPSSNVTNHLFRQAFKDAI
jgi:hypothetical protein